MKKHNAGLGNSISVFLRNYWLVLLFGLVAILWFRWGEFKPSQLSENFFIEFVSILFTIVIIDQMNRSRHERERVADLLSQLESPFPGFALEALRLLAKRGLLKKGILSDSQIYRSLLSGGEFIGASMPGVHFNMSNLSGCIFNQATIDSGRIDESIFTDSMFDGASLKNVRINVSRPDNFLFRGCRFVNANLSGMTFFCTVDGQFREAPEFQLVACRELRGSIMPNGDLYNGCYRLEGDIEHALRNHVDIENNGEMAAFYDVDIETYEFGQKWYFDNNIEHLKEIIRYTETILIDWPPGTNIDMRYIDLTKFN